MSHTPHDSLNNFQLGILKRHNYHRQKHHVAPLFWNGYLAQKAHELCEQYRQSFNWNDDTKECTFFFKSISSIPDSGQNIHITTKSNRIQAYEIVDDWYSGHNQYDYEAAMGSASVDTFTQTVWKDTVHIGVQCITFNNKQLTIALYSPKGNNHGQYRDNVLDPNLQHKTTHSTFTKTPLTTKQHDSYVVECGFRKSLTEAINQCRLDNGLRELAVSTELEEKSQQTAKLLAKLWTTLNNQSPDITLRTQLNYGMVIAFVPRRVLNANWIVDHWKNVQLPHHCHSQNPNPTHQQHDDNGERESNRTILLSPMIDLIGVGLVLNPAVCVVCIFAPRRNKPKDLTITYYKHTKHTTNCEGPCQQYI